MRVPPFGKPTLSKYLILFVFFLTIAVLIRLIVADYKSGYTESIHDWRMQKDEYFKTDSESPIIDKDSFPGLSYFIPNKAFITNAHLTLVHDTSHFSIKRNDGKNEKYIKYAIATFKLKKKEYSLLLFKLKNRTAESELLFLPFTDKTTGELTFYGGRYLDIELIDSINAEIDFNKAYNPYCAYNPRYSCPIPPKENYLDLEILAGEKIFEKMKLEDTESNTIN